MKNNDQHIHHRDYDNDEPFEKKRSSKQKQWSKNRIPENHHKRVMFDTNNFRCLHCGAFVSAERELSGVNNRNHCPNCLWSRHVDLFKPGDRRCKCQSRMEPVGLSIKRSIKKFGNEKQGELMIIHRCCGCGNFSINRIAADDDTMMIYDLFLKSGQNLELREELETQKIFMLTPRDLTTVHAQLFGNQSLLNEFVERETLERNQACLEKQESSDLYD